MNDKPRLSRGPFVGYALLMNVIFFTADTLSTDLTTGMWLPEFEAFMLLMTLITVVVGFTLAIRRCRDGGWHPAASLLILIPFGWLALLIPASLEAEPEPMELQL